METDLKLGEIPEEDIAIEELESSTPIDLNDLSSKKLGESFEKPDLDGKEVTIEDVELKRTTETKITKKSNKKYRAVIFKLHYRVDGIEETVHENYGGVQSFQNEGEWAEPTLWVDGKNAAAKLFRLWLASVNKQASEVSYKDFFVGIKGKRVRLAGKTVEYDGDEFKKNIVEAFL